MKNLICVIFIFLVVCLSAQEPINDWVEFIPVVQPNPLVQLAIAKKPHYSTVEHRQQYSVKIKNISNDDIAVIGDIVVITTCGSKLPGKFYTYLAPGESDGGGHDDYGTNLTGDVDQQDCIGGNKIYYTGADGQQYYVLDKIESITITGLWVKNKNTTTVSPPANNIQNDTPTTSSGLTGKGPTNAITPDATSRERKIREEVNGLNKTYNDTGYNTPDTAPDNRPVNGSNMCYKCNSSGRISCMYCSSTGQKQCLWCMGKGEFKCISCSGRGTYEDHVCYACNSSGKTTCPACNGKGNTVCTACNGKGDLICPYCNGRGIKH